MMAGKGDYSLRLDDMCAKYQELFHKQLRLWMKFYCFCETSRSSVLSCWMYALIHNFQSVQITQMTNYISAETSDQWDRQCAYNMTLRHIHITTEKTVSITYSQCVSVCSLSFPAGKTHAPYYIVICVPCLFYNIFPHYLINGMAFQKNLFNIKCVFWFSQQLLPETFLRKISWDAVNNVRRSSRKVPIILVRLPLNFSFLDKFSKILKYQISTDMTELIVTFRNFVNRPKNAPSSRSKFKYDMLLIQP
jgi:hypothetical protein